MAQNIEITEIHCDNPEYIELANNGSSTVDLAGFRVTSEGGKRKQEFTFPDGAELKPGKRCRVYSEPAYSFNHRAVWANKGDIGAVYDADGNELARYGYGSMAQAKSAAGGGASAGAETIDSVKAALGVSDLAVSVDQGDIDRLSTPGVKVGFLEALRSALNSFISDGNMSESPVWCMNENGLDFGLSAGADAAAKSAKVRELLNASGCTIKLFTEAEDPSDEYVGAVMCDEDGKKYGTSSYWIFKLSDSPFTDSNTAVVDKAGKKPTVNWGYS